MSSLDDNVCTWWYTMCDSLEGVGTSFDLNNLSEKQRKCLKCNGLDYECPCYNKVGDAYESGRIMDGIKG
jgi:hypothetical protein